MPDSTLDRPKSCKLFLLNTHQSLTVDIVQDLNVCSNHTTFKLQWQESFLKNCSLCFWHTCDPKTRSTSSNLEWQIFRSVQSLGRSGRRGDMRDDSAKILFQVFFFFFSGSPCDQFWHEQGCPVFDVVHAEFSLRTTASPTLQSALKNDFGEAVVACDSPEPCEFPSLDSCQKTFLWTHKVALAQHPVVGLALQVGDTEKFPLALGFESLHYFFRVSKQSPFFTAVEEDGGDRRFVELELLAKLMVLHHQILFA